MIAVQLPPGFTCDNCVLQVTQFMSEHDLNDPGGCFYHHCANITIQAGGGGDGGGGGDAGTPSESSDGCGCAVGDARVSSLGLALMLALLAARRPRPRRHALTMPPETRTGS
jgi:MYXO-CTERM domain-containing protein